MNYRGFLACSVGLLLAGCATTGGTSAGIFPSPYVSVDKDGYVASVTVLPDATDPNVIAVRTSYTSKRGDIPDIAFEVTKPDPSTVVGTAKIRLGAQQIEK